MTAKDISISGSTWHHQDRESKDLAFITLAIGLLSIIAVAVLRPHVEALLSALLLVSLISLVVFLAQSKTTNIEIDREKAAVIKTTNYRVFTSSKKYPLKEFEEVELRTVDEPIEDGYRTIRYSIVLSGKVRTLELLSTDTEGEGKAIKRELAEFLGMTAQGAANSRNERAGSAQ